MKIVVQMIACGISISLLLLAIGCKKEEARSTQSALLTPDPAELNAPAPGKFQIKFETTAGDFTIEVYRDWSPHGVDRLYYLVKHNFYDGVRFFRVIDGFMAQFGYHGDPAVSKVWTSMVIPDDPVKASNLRGYVSFAKRAIPDSRTTQLFINLVDNSYLDDSGFSPIGNVIAGMDIVDRLYSGYGDGAPKGRGPDQTRTALEGNDYLTKNFPKLDYIKKTVIISE